LKKVLIICTGAYHSDGGIAALNRLVIQVFLEQGYTVHVYALLESDAGIDPRCLSSGANVECRAFAGNKYAFSLAVWRALARSHYDYVCVDHVNLAAILAPLHGLKRCHYIVWLCGLEVFPPRPDQEGSLGLKGAWKRLAISEFTRQSVIGRFPDLLIDVCELSLDPIRHPGNLERVQTGSSVTSILLEASDGSQADLKDRVILHVGRMTSGERYKGQESLIRAFPMVHQQHPNVQLLLAGQGEDMPRLKRIVRELPPAMQARIFLPGYISDDVLDQIYKKCYVFAMPSIGEGFGLVYLEAMIRAKACLGARVDATPFVIRDGINGLLVDDPRAPEQVAKALNWFLSHPEEAHRMGRAGYDLVCSNYMFPHFQERFWKAISS
jgi:phosphatidyl-myo-inositol dimannoside synthase